MPLGEKLSTKGKMLYKKVENGVVHTWELTRNRDNSFQITHYGKFVAGEFAGNYQYKSSRRSTDQSYIDCCIALIENDGYKKVNK